MSRLPWQSITGSSSEIKNHGAYRPKLNSRPRISFVSASLTKASCFMTLCTSLTPFVARVRAAGTYRIVRINRPRVGPDQSRARIQAPRAVEFLDFAGRYTLARPCNLVPLICAYGQVRPLEGRRKIL